MMESDNLYDLYERDYVAMHIEGLTHGTSLDAYVAILRADEEDLLFPVLLDKEGHTLVHRALMERDFTPTRLMIKLARRMGFDVDGVRIARPSDGSMKAFIDFTHDDGDITSSLSVSASEGLLTAIDAAVPIYVLREAAELQKKHPQQGDAVALPLTAMSDALIEQALEEAVQNDQFELATVLRDELRKRKGQ